MKVNMYVIFANGSGHIFTQLMMGCGLSATYVWSMNTEIVNLRNIVFTNHVSVRKNEIWKNCI